MENDFNGTVIGNSKVENQSNQCPAPSNQINMTVASNCSGYESVVSNSMTNGSCAVSCDSCKNFKNHKCVVNLYDKVLCSIDDCK